MKRIIIPALAAMALASPVMADDRVTLRTPYDAEAQIIQAGNGGVEGNAFMRTRNGEVVTCAGFAVHLTRDTPYVRERLDALYEGDMNTGFQRQYFDVEFTNTDPRYAAAGRSTVCDSSGNFEFTGLADGSYFVNTIVEWRVGNRLQGGRLMARFEIEDGQTKRVVLTY